MQAVTANRPLKALPFVAPIANPGVQVVLLRVGGSEGRTEQSICREALALAIMRRKEIE